MKLSCLILVSTLTCLGACSHHETYRSVSEAAAITASDIQSAHLEATITLDKIASEMASESSMPRQPNRATQPVSVKVHGQ